MINSNVKKKQQKRKIEVIISINLRNYLCVFEINSLVLINFFSISEPIFE